MRKINSSDKNAYDVINAAKYQSQILIKQQ